MSQITVDAGTKKQKSNNGVGEDYISSLPDCIMGLILSKRPTKEIVRTSILNKDWKYKWTLLYNVLFDDKMVRGGKEGFLRALETTIPKVKIILICKLDYRGDYDWARMSACIQEIFKSKVQMFRLWNHDENAEAHILPSGIINCTSLRRLVLQLPCIYRAPEQNFFPKMDKMLLRNVRFLNENSTDTLSLQFPVMNLCCFHECEWINVKFIEIHAPKMEMFTSKTVMEDPNVENLTVKIIGAKLSVFTLDGGHLETYILSSSGTTVQQAILLNDPCNNDDETLEAWGTQGRKLLRELSGIKEMKMSGLLCVSIGYAELAIPKFNILEKLELTNVLNDSGLRDVLDVATHLKCLILYEDGDDGDWEYEWFAQPPVPSCVVSHLRIVKYHHYACTQVRHDLSKLFIEHGAVLKKFIISAYDEQDEDSIKELLRSFSRANNSLQIVLGNTVLV